MQICVLDDSPVWQSLTESAEVKISSAGAAVLELLRKKKQEGEQ